MTDFTKTMIALFITTVLSSAGTISAVVVKTDNVEKSVTKIDDRLDVFEDRIRKLEIKQAITEALNNQKGRK